ncbi:MarR family transcriptional regulator [Streptomyces sp. NBC_01235]|uniref:MarR family transcriptional regulator n=1 Tax=Streptomyces sp. NBC_01235 TaxID=2903788 RepID=UPI002E154749|nr:MarR family transcriptional regulator [Streptomyces sp. NBC_01235]
MSHLQYEVLVRLGEALEEGELRTTELADALCDSKSGLTHQVTQVEKAGLMRRRSCAGDVRADYPCLTETGQAVLPRATSTWCGS